MSTDAQLAGDSLRRQTERTAQFAERHGLILDASFTLNDIGYSAFDGSNLEKGSLGRFLAAVKAGKIATGSYLLVESLDRLSRQAPRQALPVFLDLLNSGIFIATMIDERIYAPDSTDPMELLTSILFMSRAHDESLHKSVRVAAAWKNKRDNSSNRILTRRCKAWLAPHADKTGFEVIAARAEIVKRIFKEAVEQGSGADSIARRLNRERVPVFERATGWHKSYVLKILRDRAVLGEFQPHTKVNGKRRPEGNVLPGYYPAVVSEELFYRAQACLTSRKLRGGGRRGPRVSNLFSKLGKCGLCGAPMAYVNKGPRDGTYLTCDGARRGLPCLAVRWRYDQLERTVLTFIREIDLASLFRETGGRDGDASPMSSLPETEGRLLEARLQRDRIFALLMTGKNSTFLEQKLHEQDSIVVELETEYAAIQKIESDRSIQVTDFAEGAEELSQLIERVQRESSEDAYKLRSAIAARLRDVVGELLVWPAGRPANPGALQALKAAYPERDPAELAAYLSHSCADSRGILVRFKNGAYRFVNPALADPMVARGMFESGGYLSLDTTIQPSDEWLETHRLALAT